MCSRLRISRTRRNGGREYHENRRENDEEFLHDLTALHSRSFLCARSTSIRATRQPKSSSQTPGSGDGAALGASDHSCGSGIFVSPVAVPIAGTAGQGGSSWGIRCVTTSRYVLRPTRTMAGPPGAFSRRIRLLAWLGPDLSRFPCGSGQGLYKDPAPPIRRASARTSHPPVMAALQFEGWLRPAPRPPGSGRSEVAG